MGRDGLQASGSWLKSWLWRALGAPRARNHIQLRKGTDIARENLWLVKCTDRDDDDVGGLREEHMAGHLAHIEAIVDHVAMAGPLKDPAGEKIVGSVLVYRTDDLEQAKT